MLLSRKEVLRLLQVLSNMKRRTLLTTVYSSGLRVSEVVNLKPGHIESERMMIRVEQGKGRKDRYTLLSKRLLGELRSYWKIKRPAVWLFPGIKRNEPLCTRAAQKVYTQAVSKAKNEWLSLP